MSRAKTIVITFAVIGLLLFFAESALARFTPIVIQSSDWTLKDRIDVRGGRYFRRYYGDQPGCKSISRSDINGLSVRTNPTLTFVFVGNALGIACYHPVLNRMVHSKSDVTIVQYPKLGTGSYREGVQAFTYKRDAGKTGEDRFVVRVCGTMHYETGCLTTVYRYVSGK
jgi:hypothetical protein